MKVAYLLSRAMQSGPINQSLNILRGLNEIQNVDVTLITFEAEIEGATWLLRFKEASIKIIQLNLQSKNLLIAASKLRALVKKEKFDIIHGCGTRVDLIALLANTSAKLVITHRSYPDMIAEGKPEILRKIIVPIYMKAMKKMDAVVACSYSMQEAFLKQCNMKLNVVQNAVNTNFFVPVSIEEKRLLRKKLNIDDKPTFLVLGTLRPRKNNQLIIEAVNSISNFDGQVLFVGAGPEEQKLKETAQSNRNIHFMGSTLTPIDYLQASDYFISASLSEGLPNSVLEAISCGLVPILSNIAPHQEIVENTNVSFVFDPLRREELVARIEEVLLKNLQILAEESRTLAVTVFGVNTMANKYYSVYKDILK